MFVVYFTIPTDGKHHHPTMQEILASDQLDAGMLENVTDDGLYSWHDIETFEDVQRVLKYIAENIGNYPCEVEEESCEELTDETRVIAEILFPVEETLEISCKELQDYFLADYAGEIVLGNVILAETGELLLGECTNECPDGFMSEMLENYLLG